MSTGVASLEACSLAAASILVARLALLRLTITQTYIWILGKLVLASRIRCTPHLSCWVIGSVISEIMTLVLKSPLVEALVVLPRNHLVLLLITVERSLTMHLLLLPTMHLLLLPTIHLLLVPIHLLLVLVIIHLEIIIISKAISLITKLRMPELHGGLLLGKSLSVSFPHLSVIIIL
jgi:hypothetical protein